MMDKNLESIRNNAIDLLYLEPVIDKEIPFIIHHPFFDANPVYYVNKDGTIEFIDITKEKDKFNQCLSSFESNIKNAKDFESILFKINKKYRLLFFYLSFDYLSKEKFNTYLKEVWTSSESPNKDINVNVSEVLKLFNKADKSLLMNEDELDIYNKLDNEVKVYRGTKNKDDFKAMSWTLDYDKAEWFANRFGTDGYILEATINKNDIVAFFDVRGESEVVVDYNKLKNITYELVKNIKL